MARIRSIHPGIASDEAFMSMSMAAKAAWPILWTECDDSGVFEWKPIVLKARIFPADHVDFSALLDEWVQLGSVRRFELEGKSFGVIRNFGKYQRPKNPSYRYSLPEGLRNFACLSEPKGDSPPPALPPSDPTPPEKRSLMKEGVGGGKGEGEEGKEPPTGGSKKRATSLPDDFAPDTAWAITQGLSGQEARTEAEQFKDFWRGKGGKDGLKADWPATWRMWVRNHLKRRSTAPPPRERRLFENDPYEFVDTK